MTELELQIQPGKVVTFALEPNVSISIKKKALTISIKTLYACRNYIQILDPDLFFKSDTPTTLQPAHYLKSTYNQVELIQLSKKTTNQILKVEVQSSRLIKHRG